MSEMAKNWLAGKKGVIMGVANDRSIAWGISKAAHEAGAELAFTYQGEALEKRVKPLADSIGSSIVLPCDVTNMDSIEQTFKTATAADAAAAEQLEALQGVTEDAELVW